MELFHRQLGPDNHCIVFKHFNQSLMPRDLVGFSNYSLLKGNYKPSSSAPTSLPVFDAATSGCVKVVGMP